MAGGHLNHESRDFSSWWREVGRIRDGRGVEGESWFEENVRRKVGDDFDTLFWTNKWV